MRILVENLLTLHPILPLARTLAETKAYIDPNTGGMLFQILAALLGVISAFLLFFSGRIKKTYYRLVRRAGKSPVEANNPDQPDNPSIE